MKNVPYAFAIMSSFFFFLMSKVRNFIYKWKKVQVVPESYNIKHPPPNIAVQGKWLLHIYGYNAHISANTKTKLSAINIFTKETTIFTNELDFQKAHTHT